MRATGLPWAPTQGQPLPVSADDITWCGRVPPRRRAARLRLTPLAALVVACATAATPRAPERTAAAVDFTAVDAWLACQQATRGDCARSGMDTAGWQIADDAVATFGPPPVDETAPPDAAAVAALVTQMRGWSDMVDELRPYLPDVVGGPVRIFVVANGHAWGDAYVRQVNTRDGRWRLSEAGEPVAILNALRIAANYRDGPVEQAASARGVLRHEVFHVLSKRWRSADPAWREKRLASAVEDLQLTVLEEGAAHLMDGEPRMRGARLMEHGALALGRLAEVMTQLSGIPANAPEAESQLLAATQGKFWEKFGSISGLLLAHGVERAYGADGIRESMRCGPRGLVERYQHARAQDPSLPALPAAWADPSAWFSVCP